MDHSTFDRLARSIAASGSRRGLIRFVAGGTLATVAAALLADVRQAAEAKGKGRKARGESKGKGGGGKGGKGGNQKGKGGKGKEEAG